MPKIVNTNLAEQEAERRFCKASNELDQFEKKRLQNIFQTLAVIRSNVEAGDRGAMLDLLSIVADTLRNFSTAPEDARDSLAECLEAMRKSLEEAKGFLPRGRGERSIQSKRNQDRVEFFTAMAVEYSRRSDRWSLDVAIAKVAEESGLTESLVQKRWKRHHKEADASLESANAILKKQGVEFPELPRHKMKRIPKKVR